MRMRVTCNKRRPVLLLCGLLLLSLSGCGDGGHSSEQPALAVPAFSVDVPYPTADKPQSKLWYAEGRWWAWLPTGTGSSIWQRTPSGWRRDITLDPFLNEIPGRADVWSEDGLVRAVLAAPHQLSVATLTFDREQNRYVPSGEPTIWTPSAPGATETATIARDPQGRWWLAWDDAGLIQVRATLETGAWSEPHTLAAASPGDLCTIVPLPDGVGVFWSDAIADAYWFRRHRSSDESADREEHWEAIEEVDRGPQTADDHLNAAVASDGTIHIAARRRTEQVGAPQLVLYSRRDGGWTKKAFAEKSVVASAGRPIILLTADPDPRRWVVYSSYLSLSGGGRTSQIHALEAMAGEPSQWRSQPLLMAAEALNNATSCKLPLPAEADWLILASDGNGGVYEANLKQLKQPTSTPEP